MEWEELNVIWDAQNERTLYAIDQEALERMVRKRGGDIGRYVGIFEFFMIGIVLGVGVMTLVEPVFFGHDHHQIPGAALSLLAGAYLLNRRRQRKKMEAGFDNSLRGDLDKAIARINFQIGQLRSFLWWFVLPMSVGSIISFIVLHNDKPAWIWPLTVAAMLFAWWTIRRDLHAHALPKKREFEALRDKLLGD